MPTVKGLGLIMPLFKLVGYTVTSNKNRNKGLLRVEDYLISHRENEKVYFSHICMFFTYCDSLKSFLEQFLFFHSGSETNAQVVKATREYQTPVCKKASS